MPVLRTGAAFFGREFRFAWVVGLLMGVATIVFAWEKHLPIRDPDAVIPGYIRFPAIVLAAILFDIAPRAMWRAGLRPRRLRQMWREVVRERWPASHLVFALSGVAAWYLTYAAFRNLKSLAPFVNSRNWDDELAQWDQALFLGHDPAVLLHDWLGTGLAGHVFSSVYIIWIVLVPVSIAIALVWARNVQAGAWYVTAVVVDWLLGAAIYLLVPTVGPIYSEPDQFTALPETYVSRLQDSMLADRTAVLADPWAADTLQTIAAFASLHVGIMVTICLIAEYVGLQRWLRIASWAFLAMTVVATVYLGWHFFVDVLGGVAVGWLAVWAGALATGNRVGLRPRLAEVPEAELSASGARP